MGHLNVSIFSIFSSLILFNIAAIIIVLKRKNTAFIAKYRDRKSTRLNSSHSAKSRMPSSA